MDRRTPRGDEVRAALVAVLGSPVFESAGRAREFLRYIVEETLAGRSDRLKGYSIAIAVFEREPSFDAQADPLVRVEAGRLRRRLAEYYDGDGRQAAVRIALPRGGYTPTFEYRAEAEVGAPRPAAAGGNGRLRVWVVALAAAALGATAGIAAFLGSRGPGNGSSLVESARKLAASDVYAPRLVVLPLASLGDAALDAVARGITDEIIHSLVTFNILPTASAAAESAGQLSSSSLREQYGAGYALAGSVRAEGDLLRVTVRVTDTTLGTQLWTRSFDQTAGDGSMLAFERRTAQAVAELLASPFGPIYGHEIQRIAGKPIADLDPYECLLRFYEYSRSLAEREHGDCVRCMQRAADSEPDFARAWSSLAVLYLHEYMFGYTPQPDRGPALDRALEALRRALDLDGSGRVAGMALASIRLASGDRQGFEQAVRRGLAQSPVHPAVKAQLGYSLTLSGDAERGLPLLEEAIPATAQLPGWYYAAFVMADLEKGDYNQALQYALRMDAPNWLGTPLMVAASAALAGRTDIAEREAQHLIEMRPDFASTGRELLRHWGMDDRLLATLIEGLRLAGVDLA